MAVTRATLRVSIVGAGLMGRWHAYAAERAGGRVVAIVDADAGRARQLASRHRHARAFDSLDAAIEATDVVHVCTPTATHAAIAAQALGAHRHVLVEKPAAASAADVAALVDLAASNSVICCPAHQFLFQDGVRAALASPVVRALRHVDITICSAGASGAADDAREQIAVEILPHPVSLLARMMPAAVRVADWSARRPRPGEIRALAQLGDVTATLVVSMSGRPTVNRMLLIGEGSTVHVDLFHGFAATLPGGVSRSRKIAQPFTNAAILWRAAAWNLVARSWRREPAYPGLTALVERFYESVRTGGPPPIAAEEALLVAETCDRLNAP